MRRRPQNPILVASLLALFAVGAGILYINTVTYVMSAKALLIDEIECATGKKVFFRSIRFSLLKGLVLEKLVLYDESHLVVKTREVSCGLILPSILDKRIIVPVIRVESPVIYVERRPDGKLSIFDLIPVQYAPKSCMALSIHKVVIKRGIVHFVDKALGSTFHKTIQNLDAVVRLYLPVRVTFTLSCYAASSSGIILASGEYIVPSGNFTCDAAVSRLALKDFLPYYQDTGLSFPSGTLDATASTRFRNGVLDADIEANTKNLFISRGAVKVKVDSGAKAHIRHDFSGGGRPVCEGTMNIRTMDIYGLEGVGRLEGVKAQAIFTESRFFAEHVDFELFGSQWDATINLVNFKKPILDIYMHSSMRLGVLEQMLKEYLKVQFLTDMAGKGDVKLSIQAEGDKPPKINGYLSIEDATISLGAGNFPIENGRGKFSFDLHSLTWSDFKCSYRGVEYSGTGTMTDFKSPRLRVSVSSRDLSYKIDLSVWDKAVTLHTLEGRFFNSDFSVSGDTSFEDPEAIDTDVKGYLAIDVSDLRKVFTDFPGIHQMKPAGRLRSKFELSGDIKDLKTCFIDAKMKADAITLYGLKIEKVSFEYVQEQGVAAVKSLRSSFYGGALSASAAIDWMSTGVPYSVKADAFGVKLDKLKADTGFRDKDVSGEIKVYADLKGVFKDLSSASGIGHASIEKSKLWQLDLFKGAGAIIFTSDFSNIVFTDGECDFKLSGNAVTIDNFTMKSEELELFGSGRIGFDRSVSGMLRPEINKDVVLEGTAGNLAVAVGKGTVIEISGTLKDPKFKTRTNVVDVVGAMLQQQ